MGTSCRASDRDAGCQRGGPGVFRIGRYSEMAGRSVKRRPRSRGSDDRVQPSESDVAQYVCRRIYDRKQQGSL